MKLNINLAQKGYAQGQIPHVAYIVLSCVLALTLSLNYYWYSSVTADIARYRERLSKIEGLALKTKGGGEESVSPQERESLIKEADFINNVIKSRTLSWSGLLSHLEKEIVHNISLISLSPNIVDNGVRIDIKGVGKDLETITRFMDRLEKSPFFQDAFLLHTTDAELNGERLVNFTMELEYTGK